MRNPWQELPRKPPFVLAIDAPSIPAILTRTRDRQRPHLEILPEPFGGNVEAPVLFLDSHPGFSPGDVPAYADPAYAAACRASLRLEAVDWPIFQLDPRFRATPGGEYYLRLFETLVRALRNRLGGTTEDAWRRLASSVGFIHLFPYHREESAPNQRVPSQEFGLHLVRRAMERNALLVIRNAESQWIAAIPRLARYPRRCKANSPRTPVISPGNVPEGWFDQIIDAIAGYTPPAREDEKRLVVEVPPDLPLEQFERVRREVETIVRDVRLRPQVLAHWGPACAVCGLELCSPAGSHECEVAHVVPAAEDGPDALANALPLCRTHHWAFDEHLWAIEPDTRTVFVREAYRDCPAFARHHGAPLRGSGVDGLDRARLVARWQAFVGARGAESPSPPS
jgi:hypothetical protein